MVKVSFLAFFIISFVFVQSAGEAAATSLICGIISFVQAVIGILVVAMFILGGILYAVGHFLPQTGNLRGNMQSWAMGMLLAGIIALILFIIAKPVVFLILKMGGAFGGLNATFSCSIIQKTSTPLLVGVPFSNSTASGIYIFNVSRNQYLLVNSDGQLFHVSLDSIGNGYANVSIDNSSYRLVSGKVYPINNSTGEYAGLVSANQSTGLAALRFYRNKSTSLASKGSSSISNVQNSSKMASEKAVAPQKIPGWVLVLITVVLLVFISIIIFNLIQYYYAKNVAYRERKRREYEEAEAKAQQESQVNQAESNEEEKEENPDVKEEKPDDQGG